jgi:hypothetical protein
MASNESSDSMIAGRKHQKDRSVRKSLYLSRYDTRREIICLRQEVLIFTYNSGRVHKSDFKVDASYK